MSLRVPQLLPTGYLLLGRAVGVSLIFALANLPGKITAASASETVTPSMIHVSGIVHFGGQKASMTQLYYSRKKSDEGAVLALLFSDHLLASSALDDRQQLTALARKRAFTGLYVELDESGHITTTDLFHDDGSFTGSWSFEPAKGNTANTAGRISTDGEQDFFDKTYAINVAFKVGPKIDETWRGSDFYETKPTGLAPGQAEGWMERHEKRTTLSQALAVSETDLFGDSGERKLFLSNAPLTEAMLAAAMGPEQEMQKAGVEFLRISLNGKNEIQSVMVPSEDGDPINFTSSYWAIELAKSAAGEFDGRAELLSSKDADSDFPRFEVRFHATTSRIGTAAPVTIDNGKALPRDGGEPGKAYRDFVSVLKKAKTLEELVPFRISQMVEMINAIPAEQRGAMLEFLKQEAQTPYKIIGGFVNAGQATLWLESQQGEEKIEGRINLHRETGSWKLGMEAFRSQSETEP